MARSQLVDVHRLKATGSYCATTSQKARTEYSVLMAQHIAHIDSTASTDSRCQQLAARR
jgi:hypothetical protein